MKSIDKIPTSKIARASKMVSTGAKIGVNYLKYSVNQFSDKEAAKEKLDKDNAEDVYDTLKDLKGSALKMAQMMSMEKNLLPKAYVEKFSLSQFSVPPLSGPLVKKTFKKSIGKYPNELFDTFSDSAINAASIGQVHKASIGNQSFAVKIQYPGVADSIKSDLEMVKPMAMAMFKIPKSGSEKYFQEVENKLAEETDYTLELKQSNEISKNCKDLENIVFPKYYSEYSSDQVLTMDWMDGIHLSEWIETNPSQEERNKIAQAFWDFYFYSIHKLRKVHADPHPGNFLITKDNKLIAIDFGCMKELPESFYNPYFELTTPENLNNPEIFEKTLYQLEILLEDDSEEDKEFFKTLFHGLLSVFIEPLSQDVFDFGKPEYFEKITELGMKLKDDKAIRSKNPNRGSKHFIYLNRTFFGIYNIMNDLKGEIKVHNYLKYS